MISFSTIQKIYAATTYKKYLWQPQKEQAKKIYRASRKHSCESWPNKKYPISARNRMFFVGSRFAELPLTVLNVIIEHFVIVFEHWHCGPLFFFDRSGDNKPIDRKKGPVMFLATHNFAKKYFSVQWTLEMKSFYM